MLTELHSNQRGTQAIPLRVVVQMLEDVAHRANYEFTIDIVNGGTGCEQSHVLKVLRASGWSFPELYQAYYEWQNEYEQVHAKPVVESRYFVSLTILLLNWFNDVRAMQSAPAAAYGNRNADAKFHAAITRDFAAFDVRIMQLKGNPDVQANRRLKDQLETCKTWIARLYDEANY